MEQITKKQFGRIIKSSDEDAGKLVLKTVDINAPPIPFPGEKEKPHDLPYLYRSAYQYIPKSGVYDSVQTSTITVLRHGNDEKSAVEIVEKCGLSELAEENHFILVLPNCEDGGWNYGCDSSKSDDVYFLNKIQFVLSRGRDVNAHSSLSYYIGIDDGASMAMTLAALNPQGVTAVLAINVGDDYKIPANATYAAVTAWISGENKVVEEYLKKSDAISGEAHKVDDVEVYENENNRAIKIIVGKERTPNKALVENAWENVFSKVRRWGNNPPTFGTYEERIDFDAKGFVPHEDEFDERIDAKIPRTWYEYAPSDLGEEKIPLLIGMHGVGCVPLYYAEQHRWDVVADKEKFLVAYLEAGENKHWNIGMDPQMADDESFILNVIGYMKKKYNVDEERIYIAGFSNGAQMANSMAAVHPEVFAAAAPTSAFFEQYYDDLRILPYYHRDRFRLKALIDAKKAEYDYKMPVIQTAGMLDRLAGNWPIRDENGSVVLTCNFWKRYNGLRIEGIPSDTNSDIGLVADAEYVLGKDERLGLNLFCDEDNVALYAFMTVKNMPHAVDLREPYIQWKYLSSFARKSNGESECRSNFDKEKFFIE